jgi:hypothetical protein
MIKIDSSNLAKFRVEIHAILILLLLCILVLAVHFSIETIDRAEAFTVTTNTLLSDNNSYTDVLVIDDG